MSPSRRVIVAAGACDTLIERVPKPGFESPFNPEEQQRIAKSLGLLEGDFNDERAVRLEWMREDTNGQLRLGISRISFLDALTTNLAIDPCCTTPDTRRWTTRAADEYATRELMSRLRLQVRSEGPSRDATDVLRIRSLANPIAVSLLLRDTRGRPGVIQRASGPNVSSADYCATVTGSVNGADFAWTDPFLHCAQREMQEELGVRGVDLVFDGIIIVRQKLQPVFLYEGMVDTTWEDLASTIAGAPDYQRESAAFLAIPPSDVSRAAVHLHLTDAASYQMWRCTRHHGTTGTQHSLRRFARPSTSRWRIC